MLHKKRESDMQHFSIREAKISDAADILNIYSYYTKHTAISFEHEVPTLEEFHARMKKTMKKYPYFVALRNENIVGYAYAGPFVGRAAYDWSAELTIYLALEEQKKGTGKKLYQALEKALFEMGILNLYACIGVPETDDEYLTMNSADFHEHLGFTKVGEFYKCGYKFHRWYHMIWMEKIIGKHEQYQPPVRCYCEIGK